MEHGETGFSSSSYRALKVALLIGAFVAYLVLSFIVAGETAYTFARERMGTVAYTILALLYAFGTAIFALGLRRLLQTK